MSKNFHVYTMPSQIVSKPDDFSMLTYGYKIYKVYILKYLLIFYLCILNLYYSLYVWFILNNTMLFNHSYDFEYIISRLFDYYLDVLNNIYFSNLIILFCLIFQKLMNFVIFN